MTQVCSKCYIEKSFNDFYFRKDCNNYRKNCKSCQCKRSDEYYYENIEHKRNYNRNYQLNNKDKLRDYRKDYNEKNQEKIKENKKNYYENNKEICNTYNRERYHSNPKYKIRQILSGRIHTALKKLKDNQITMKYLGCSIEQFYNWIEFQFYDGMNWNNYGKYWHIDHTLPVSNFDFENEEQIKKCFNWINLRPLRAEKNLSKGNKISLKEYLLQEIKSAYFLKQTNN